MAIETAVLRNINEAYETFKKRCKDYNPTESNRSLLCQHIVKTGLPHADWTLESFWSAFDALTAEGSLKGFPTEEEKRKAIEWKMYQEATASSRLESHSTPKETKEQEAVRLFREWRDGCRQAEEQADSAAQAALLREKSDRDVSHLPTFQQIADGASLSSQEQRALSAPQLREYIRRSQLAQNEIYRRQREGQNA